MPFPRPTLTALARQALADIAAASGAYAVLRTSPLAILAKAVTGLVHGVYGYIDYLVRQAIPSTATGEFLEAWGALKGVFRKSATAASGSLVFPGTVGAVLPDGTQVIRTANGATYTVSALGTVDGSGFVTVSITADSEGAAGNADDADGFTLASAVLGISNAGVADGPVTGGAEIEDNDSFRARVLTRYQNPPQGGSKSDYESWALDVPGVTRAWVAPNEAGGGTVTIRFMMDEAQAAHGGVPQGTDGVASDEPRGTTATGDQLTLANAISPLRPVTALVFSVAPVLYPINVTVTGLTPDTTALRAAVEVSLLDMFRRVAAPGGTIAESDIFDAIKATSGVTSFAVSTPAGSVTAPGTQLPSLGVLAWA